jgi:hypothetical protein
MDEWIAVDEGDLVLRNPITLQPLREPSSFVGTQLLEAHKFWKSHQGQIQLRADVGPRNIVDMIDSLVFEDIDVFGMPFPDAHHPVSDAQKKIMEAAVPHDIQLFSTVSEGNGSALALAAHDVRTLGLQVQMSEDEKFAEGDHAGAKRLSMLRAGMGIASLLSIDRFADVQHISQALSDMYTLNPALTERVESFVYLHLSSRQNALIPTFALIGAPELKVGRANAEQLNDTVAVSEIIGEIAMTGRFTAEQFKSLEDSRVL